MASLNSQSLIEDLSVHKLIQEVKLRPGLYNRSLKEYTDGNVKKYLWEEVCEALINDWHQLSTEDKSNIGREVTKKWANIRTCFRRELNFVYRKKEPARLRRRRYIHYKHLQFLVPYIENQIPGCTQAKDHDAEDDQDHQDQVDGSSTPTAHPLPVRRKINPPPSPPTPPSPPPAEPSKPTTVLDESHLNESNDPIFNVPHRSNIDEDVNFALSLVASLKDLNADEKLDAKIGILKVFKQIRQARCVLKTEIELSDYCVG
ncbi:uncharacterized protein LOC129756777 [Uranotaenia lowii]|uniref:uncharacterized protein LOC129756777 n=1 Tax=Uranotaenia lowii TaxID=190385 RepID=UPI002478D869|nr:uncharacterized protein LOC129756777 [Uranotaenia lowii]